MLKELSQVANESLHVVNKRNTSLIPIHKSFVTNVYVWLGGRISNLVLLSEASSLCRTKVKKAKVASFKTKTVADFMLLMNTDVS